MQMHHLGWTCLLAGTWTSLQMSPTSPATGLEMIQWHASQPCQLHHLLHGHAWRPSLHADHRVLGHVRRESAFLRPSGSFFGAPAPAPTMATPPSRPHSVFSHVPPRCHSFSWQSVPGTASACLQADGQEHSAPPRPPQSGPGPLFAKPEQDAQVQMQADSFQLHLCTPCTHSIFPSVDEHPSTWQPQKYTALQELQRQQGMPRQSDKDPQLVGLPGCMSIPRRCGRDW